MPDRPWSPPGRHWDDRPDVVAGLDQLAGGSWMGMNDYGLVCVVMNRVGTLGPDPHKRSRGELVLEALDHSEATEVATAFSSLAPEAYRPFNLLIGDPRSCFWIRNNGQRITVSPIPPGLHMLTALELNDQTDPRIRHYLPLFRSAPTPDPEKDDWATWKALLSSDDHPPDEPRSAAMCFNLDTGLSTLSSALIALPRHPSSEDMPIWLHTTGQPGRGEFTAVHLSPPSRG